MGFIRYFTATLLLVFSCQSQALFMPEGFKVNTDSDAVSEEGCGVLIVKSEVEI